MKKEIDKVRVKILGPVYKRISEHHIQGICPTLQGAPATNACARVTVLTSLELGMSPPHFEYRTDGWGQHVSLYVNVSRDLEPKIEINQGGTTQDVVSALAFADLLMQVTILAASVEVELRQLCKWEKNK
jgi:hypothetical protein